MYSKLDQNTRDQIDQIVDTDDLVAFKQLIQQPELINPICLNATEKGALKIVRYCFEEKLIDPYYSYEGIGFLDELVEFNEIELTELYLQKFNVDPTKLYINTLNVPEMGITELLLKYKFNPNTLRCCTTPLFEIALHAGLIDYIKLFQKYGFKPEIVLFNKIQHTVRNHDRWLSMCAIYPDLIERTNSDFMLWLKYKVYFNLPTICVLVAFLVLVILIALSIVYIITHYQISLSNQSIALIFGTPLLITFIAGIFISYKDYYAS